MSSEYAIHTIRRGFYRGVLGTLCILSMLTQFGESLDSTLTLHMTVQHILLLAPGKAMGVFGAFLMFTTLYVYPVYPLVQQTEAGLFMVVMMLLMDMIIVPYWLYRHFGKSSAVIPQMKRV